MPIIYNKNNNVSLTINLLNNTKVDIIKDRDNDENWIPFCLILVIGNEKYSFTIDHDSSFSLKEVKSLISGINRIIQLKKQQEIDCKYEFCCLEAYFEFVIYDSYEVNELSIDLWINMGELTKGEVFGFDKGVRFDVTLDSLKQFVNNLENELNNILKIYS